MISPLAALFLLIPWVNKIWNRLKWLSSRTWVSAPTYLCSWQACGALLQPLHRKKKKISDSIPLYLKFSCFPQIHSWRQQSWVENSALGQSWTPLGRLGHVGEAAEPRCSQSLSFMIHRSLPQAAGFAQLDHRRKQTVSLEGQGGNWRYIWDD